MAQHNQNHGDAEERNHIGKDSRVAGLTRVEKVGAEDKRWDEVDARCDMSQTCTHASIFVSQL